MSWTVACFCGHLYSTPPDRCPACGVELPEIEPSETRLEFQPEPPAHTRRLVEEVRA